MIYRLYEKDIEHFGECGIYKERTYGMMNYDYAVMSLDGIIDILNKIGREKAIIELSALNKLASEQLQWREVPGSLGSPLLIRTGTKPIQVENVRENIQNTLSLTDKLLKALK